MRKTTVPDFVKGFLFATLLIGACFVFASHKDVQQISSGTMPSISTSADHDAIGAIANWILDMKISDFLIASLTAVLAWKTAGLDRSTKALWQAGEKQIALADRSAAAAEAAVQQAAKLFTLDQRPWVAFEHNGPSTIKLLTSSLTVEVPIHVHNYGNSPALLVNYGLLLFDASRVDNLAQYLEHIGKASARVSGVNWIHTTSVFPGKDQALTRTFVAKLTDAERERQTINKSLDYVVFVTYQHPISKESYCTAHLYSILISNISSYALHEVEVSRSQYSTHQIPGGRFFS